MSKHRFFVGLAIAVLVVIFPVGAQLADACATTGVSQAHACCAEKSERTASSCCSSNSTPDPEPDHCMCSHAPEAPAGFIPAVAEGSPDLFAANMVESFETIGRSVLMGLPGRDSRRGPPGGTVDVFILDCALLI